MQTLAQAREAAAAGADVIIAQGTEAGGHGQSQTLFTLLPQVVDACPDIPVVAAGGIADGRGLAAAMMLGAEGALIGTPLLRLAGSRRPSGGEAADRGGRGAARAFVRVVFDLARKTSWPEPYTGRVLRNQHTERWLGREAELAANADEVARGLRGGARAGRLRRGGWSSPATPAA